MRFEEHESTTICIGQEGFTEQLMFQLSIKKELFKHGFKLMLL